jgi:hypothetical protein
MSFDAAHFDQLQTTLEREGAAAAIESLCMLLRERHDYARLFYALLLRKRHELGVSPIPSEPAEHLAADVHDAYEEGIRRAAREVGFLYLDRGDIPRAWYYFRMLDEPKPVAEAIERLQPAPDDDVQAIVEIALYHGVHPRKGFELLLAHFGICSAITVLSSGEFRPTGEIRTHCLGKLVRALYRELCDRLAADIHRQEGKLPQVKTVRELIAGRDWLFGDDLYHVDTSHLAAVVRFAVHLPRGEELDLARELCDYGQRLSPKLHYDAEPPFDDIYRDYAIYLDALAGRDADAGVAHFRRKMETADLEECGTLPVEALVNLLLRLDRRDEALEVARQHLLDADPRRLTCPSIQELCRLTGRYDVLAESARAQDDPVHFLAGLLARTRCTPECSPACSDPSLEEAGT